MKHLSIAASTAPTRVAAVFRYRVLSSVAMYYLNIARYISGRAALTQSGRRKVPGSKKLDARRPVPKLPMAGRSVPCGRDGIRTGRDQESRAGTCMRHRRSPPRHARSGPAQRNARGRAPVPDHALKPWAPVTSATFLHAHDFWSDDRAWCLLVGRSLRSAISRPAA